MQKPFEVETIATFLAHIRSVAKESRRKKSVGARAGWRPRQKKIRFRDLFLALREDKTNLLGGRRKRLFYIEQTDAVIIVPVTPEGEMALINQDRYSGPINGLTFLFR